MRGFIIFILIIAVIIAGLVELLILVRTNQCRIKGNYLGISEDYIGYDPSVGCLIKVGGRWTLLDKVIYGE